MLLKFSDVMSSYDIFVNFDWKNQIFFYEFGPLYKSHDKYFYGKKTLHFVSPT